MHPLQPVVPVLSLVMNHRDHRKIVVIDGRIAYTGGVNLADEYINHVEKFGRWKMPLSCWRARRSAL